MIQAENLTKVYGDFTAIEDVSLNVEKGEILGFLGPNGAGKTTTMRILTCYTPATRGKASVAGFDVRNQSLEVRKRIGYLPEHVPLYTEMTTKAYLRFMAEAKGMRGRKAKQAVDQAIEECGLGEVRERLVGHTSRGYRQRIGLAQAVVGDPDVLILDEPTIGLDPRQIVEIRDLIKGMAGRRTVILSSHILPEVSLTCQRVLIINRGKIVASGTPDEMLSNLDERRQTQVLASGPAAQISERLSKLDGVSDVRIVNNGDDKTPSELLVETGMKDDPRPRIAKAVHDGGWELFELHGRGASLEDVFIRIIAGEEGRHAA